MGNGCLWPLGDARPFILWKASRTLHFRPSLAPLAEAARPAGLARLQPTLRIARLRPGFFPGTFVESPRDYPRAPRRGCKSRGPKTSRWWVCVPGHGCHMDPVTSGIL